MGDAHSSALLGRNDKLANDQRDVEVPAVLRDVLVASAVCALVDGRRRLDRRRDAGWLRASCCSSPRTSLDSGFECVEFRPERCHRVGWLWWGYRFVGVDRVDLDPDDCHREPGVVWHVDDGQWPSSDTQGIQ
jgi:hypothetical protein